MMALKIMNLIRIEKHLLLGDTLKNCTLMSLQKFLPDENLCYSVKSLNTS